MFFSVQRQRSSVWKGMSSISTWILAAMETTRQKVASCSRRVCRNLPSPIVPTSCAWFAECRMATCFLIEVAVECRSVDDLRFKAVYPIMDLFNWNIEWTLASQHQRKRCRYADVTPEGWYSELLANGGRLLTSPKTVKHFRVVELLDNDWCMRAETLGHLYRQAATRVPSGSPGLLFVADHPLLPRGHRWAMPSRGTQYSRRVQSLDSARRLRAWMWDCALYIRYRRQAYSMIGTSDASCWLATGTSVGRLVADSGVVSAGGCWSVDGRHCSCHGVQCRLSQVSAGCNSFSPDRRRWRRSYLDRRAAGSRTDSSQLFSFNTSTSYRRWIRHVTASNMTSYRRIGLLWSRRNVDKANTKRCVKKEKP